MITELERLKTWMDRNEYDAVGLQKTLGMRFSIQYIVSGAWPIHDGIRYRFLDTFGESAFVGIFSADRMSYLLKYAAQSSVVSAVSKGQLLPAKIYKCHNCNAMARHYHHASYAREDRLRVVPLCGSCHRRHHMSGLQLAPLSAQHRIPIATTIAII